MIDERAVVSPKASVHEEAQVGPFSIIGPDVEIGRGTRVESHVVVKGPTRIGEDNHIYQFSSIGDDPQDKKYAGEPTELLIGDRNTIREYCTINRGTTQDEGRTVVGNDNWIMAYSHIAHDCVVGDHTILANNATLAGHVHVGNYAILGGFTGVHQFCRIGTGALCSVLSYVSRDVPAYVIVAGRPAAPRGINAEGLKRRGVDAAAIRALRDAYGTVFRQGLKLEEAIRALEARETVPLVAEFVASLTAGERGLAR